jgi:hypothetical protein
MGKNDPLGHFYPCPSQHFPSDTLMADRVFPERMSQRLPGVYAPLRPRQHPQGNIVAYQASANGPAREC